MSADRIHRLFLASAGTGKTYQLTGHYLRLLLAGVEPRRILATTFTRKAAGEILDRVLLRLVKAAEDAGEREALEKQLGVPVEREVCLQLLAQLVRGLDRLQVRTIDAFFVTLGQLFALELGLPAGWSIADEVQELGLRKEAFARMLTELSQDELVELLRSLTPKTAGTRKVLQPLTELVQQGREIWLDSAPPAWECVQVPAGLSQAQLEEVVTFLEAYDVPKTQKGTPNSNWTKALGQLVEQINEGDWENFGKAGLVKKYMEGELEYAKHPMSDSLCERFDLLALQHQHHVLSELSARNQARARLLAYFESAWSAVQRERGLYGFGDLPRALAGDGGDDPLQARDLDLAYRLDGRIDHLLLDEFQDTAPVQWQVLSPMAEEIASTFDGTRSFFCVGDVKQSIYGFRSAEPRLLSELKLHLPGLEEEEMVVSYRSSPVVIDTVNRVFTGIHKVEALADLKRSSYRAGARAWLEGYPVHEAHQQDLPGAAVLLEAEPPEEDEKTTDSLRRLAVERVVALVEEAPRATIGVLVRNNKPIPQLIHALLSLGIAASGEGGNALTDSRAVLHLISLLYLADHPGDSLAAFTVQVSPLGPIVQEQFPELEGSFHPRDLSQALRRRLFAEGLGAFCGRLLPAVLVCADYEEWDRRRFRQAVDQAFQFDSKGGRLRIDPFVEHLRHRKVEDPDASQVKVMTVHASKGLEFDVVVLPELNADLEMADRKTVFWTERLDPREAFNRVCLRPPSGLDVHGDLESLRDQHLQRAVGENLSILYVAMTRAKRRLEMLVPVPGGRLTYAEILRQQLQVDEADGNLLWKHEASSHWAEGLTEVDAPTQEASPARALALAPSRGARGLAARSPSGREKPRRMQARDLWVMPSQDGARRGILFHTWLAQVEWLQTFGLDDAALLELGRRIEPDEARRVAYLEEFRAALAMPTLQGVLNRPDPLESVPEIWRERSFCVVLEESGGDDRSLWSGSFDRVIVWRDDGGRAIRAEIIDYKTDRVDERVLQEHSEGYRSQLESYRRALKAMTGLPEDRIGMTLLYLQTDRRVAL